MLHQDHMDKIALRDRADLTETKEASLDLLHLEFMALIVTQESGAMHRDLMGKAVSTVLKEANLEMLHPEVMVLIATPKWGVIKHHLDHTDKITLLDRADLTGTKEAQQEVPQLETMAPIATPESGVRHQEQVVLLGKLLALLEVLLPALMLTPESGARHQDLMEQVVLQDRVLI